MTHHGTVVWNELTTSDLVAAKAFYAATLGWTYEEIPTPVGPYTLARRPDQSRPVAGLLPWPPGEDGGDEWFTYVAVDDIEATIASAKASGGRVTPIYQVPGVGHFVTVEDPTGATFGVMQRLSAG